MRSGRDGCEGLGPNGVQPWESDVGRLGWGGVMVGWGHRNEYRVNGGGAVVVVERCVLLVLFCFGFFCFFSLCFRGLVYM